MWKRLAIRLALQYVDRYFHKWMLTNDNNGEVVKLLQSFQMYLRSLKSKTAFYIANLLDDWRE